MVKRRGHNEGTIKLRSDGRWEAKISLPNGTRKSLYGKKKSDVQDKLRAAQRDLHAGLDIGKKSQTLSEHLDHWLVNTAKPKVRPSTWTAYESYIRNHIKPSLGHHRVADLAPQHVEAFLNDCQTKGLSPTTVTQVRAILRRSLRFAVRWGLVSQNVVALTDAPRLVKVAVEPLTVEELRTFVRAVRGHRYGPLYAVAAMTGLRQGELLGLRWSDIDLDLGALHVRKALQRIDGRPTLVQPKTAQSRRTIDLPQFATGELRTQRQRQNERRLMMGSEWKNELDLVFTSTVGTPCNPSNVTHTFQKLLLDHGLKRQRFHDLRHCNASLLHAAGVDARTTKEILGHSKISTTMDIYTHVTPAAMRQAADRLNDFADLDGTRDSEVLGSEMGSVAA